jgi:hypothetical protein
MKLQYFTILAFFPAKKDKKSPVAKHRAFLD